jgi:hypothetical protein
VYKPKAREEEVQKMYIDPKRTTSLTYPDRDNGRSVEKSDKGPVVLNN